MHQEGDDEVSDQHHDVRVKEPTHPVHTWPQSHRLHRLNKSMNIFVDLGKCVLTIEDL